MPGKLKLPLPRKSGEQSLEELILKRCSRRQYRIASLSLPEISQILWAAYGVKEPESHRRLTGKGDRTCPSAGALFPLRIYLVAGDITDLPAGFYHYIPDEHALDKVHDRDLREAIYSLSYPREMILTAPASLVYTAIEDKVRMRYGERGRQRYIPMDIGHSAQNVYLQAEALGLGTCAVGAFDDDGLIQVLGRPSVEVPLYLMPIGYPA